MGIYENIKLALEGLKLNKMRAFLTMLGIIIGIASVIAILTIGRAISLTLEEGFDEFSPGLMMIYTEPEDGNWDEYYEIDYRDRMIKEKTIELLEERFDNRLDAIIYNGVSTNAHIDTGEKSGNLQIEFVSPGYIKAYKKDILTGRFLNDEDEAAARRTIVMPKSAIEEIYNESLTAVLGKTITLDVYDIVEDFVIVGYLMMTNLN